VVRVTDRRGKELLALEENMRSLRTEAIGSAEKVRVAAICDDDKRRPLDAVLARTGFDQAVDKAFQASGKAKADWLVAIKPNFMFSYSKHDPSTFTDPELVAHLARRLFDRGYPPAQGGRGAELLRRVLRQALGRRDGGLPTWTRAPSSPRRADGRRALRRAPRAEKRRGTRAHIPSSATAPGWARPGSRAPPARHSCRLRTPKASRPASSPELLDTATGLRSTSNRHALGTRGVNAREKGG
jgi:hypothetical protein